jgi:hypothetical protein
MPKVTFILGLAGSGKSYLASQISEKTGAIIFEGIEGDAEIMKNMIQHLREGGDCIVEEIAYLRPVMRDKIAIELANAISDLALEWICFENNLEDANWNVVHRMDKEDDNIKGHLHINQVYHGIYIYPSETKAIPITRVKV